MLKFLKWFLRLFSPYVSGFERRVDKFFKGIKSTDSSASVKRGLLALMQQDLVVVNLWMERKYKGYEYLDKSARRRMYEDVKKIVALFERQKMPSEGEVHKLLASKGLKYSSADAEKLRFLLKVMRFLRPDGPAQYHYIKTASFGKLLRDPAKQKLEGDCNQIVTLYSYLYSTGFDLKDLQIKLIPGHVCLHFRGIDIEATNATFQKYKEKEVLPITEIVSTNLLDLSDFREDVQKIDERTFVKSAQLAYAISSLKSLVEKNLKVAYRNLAGAALRGNNFDSASFYFSKLGDSAALKSVYNNAAVYYMKGHDFEKARYYAGKFGPVLLKKIRHNEGIYYYEKDDFDRALRIFKEIGVGKMVKACYAGMYNDLVKEVKGVRTLKDAKRKKHIYRKMLDLARKMGDGGLEKSVSETLRKM